MRVTDYKFFHSLKGLPFVDEIWLYGSRARGDAKVRSDIDLAIVCPHANNIQWQKILDIIREADTLYKIDVVRFDTLSSDDKFTENVLKFKKVLFKKGSK